MRCVVLGLLVVLGVCFTGLAEAQGLTGDLLAGKLVNPKVGQWAWYDFTDAASGEKLLIRQAVVGEEKVGRAMGHWVEFELVPEAGYKTIYKMLLTGPVSNLKNVHRILLKHGPDPVREVAAAEGLAGSGEEESGKRKSLGLENVNTPAGVVPAEHFTITSGDRTLDLWVNEQIPPSGIVRIRSPQGEMLLRSHGLEGKSAQSVIDDSVKATESKVSVGEPEPEPREQSGNKGWLGKGGAGSAKPERGTP